MICNYHTHTTRCGHARGTDREYIESAIKAGIKILGFSDHVPLPKYEPDFDMARMSFETAAEYVNTISKLREEYKNDIEIHIGFECEYAPMVFDQHMKMLKDIGCEYLILGQHFIITLNEKRPYKGYGATENIDHLKNYVDLVTEGAATGKFSYIAHPDVFLFSGDREVRDREFTRLCENVKKCGIPLEFNLQGFAEHKPFPADWFLELSAKVGNDYVIGFDAHRPDVFLDESIWNSCVEKLNSFGLHRLEKIELKSL